MSKKIEWLDTFAERYAKEIKKTASKTKSKDLIVTRDVVKNSKVGDLIKFKGGLYKVADLEFVDEIGPGVILSPVSSEVPTGDAMSMAMGTEVTGLESKCTVEPERARVTENECVCLDVDARDAEVAKMEEEARNTELKIETENCTDRTTIDGRYKKEVECAECVECAEEIVEEIAETVEMTEEVVEEIAEEAVEEIAEEAVESEEVVEEATEEVEEKENVILNKLKANKKVGGTNMKSNKNSNKKVVATLKIAKTINAAIEAEAEELLEDAELAVKETVPACNVATVLKMVEDKLEDEGVEVLFQKKVSKLAVKKTASEGLEVAEIEEIAEAVVEAVVEEFEAILEEADELCNEKSEDDLEMEAKIKTMLEKKLASIGIKAKLARRAVPAKNKVIASLSTKRSKR